MDNKIRVMLITDYPLISNLITANLEDQSDMTVVRVCSPADDVSSILNHKNADVVLISGHFSTTIALNLVKQVDEHGGLTILILGMEEDSDQLMPYIEAGVSGYILKDASVDDLVTAIRSTSNSSAAVSPNVARALIERVYLLSGRMGGTANEIFNSVQLTRREMQVLELISANMSNQEIAARLYVEVGTLKNHVHAILQKLEVNSRHQAAKYLEILRGKREERRYERER